MNFGTSDGVLKPLDEVLLPDPRFRGFEVGLKNHWRPFELADMHQRLKQIALNPTVPADPRLQFETARNLMLYTCFVFEFQTVAELQAYAALELALRIRFPDSKRKIRRSGRFEIIPFGLRRLLKRAVEEKLLDPDKLPAWERIHARRKRQEENLKIACGRPLSKSEWVEALTDAIPNLRNDLAHGNLKLFLSGSFAALELCADLINALFPDKAQSPSPAKPVMPTGNDQPRRRA